MRRLVATVTALVALAVVVPATGSAASTNAERRKRPTTTTVPRATTTTKPKTWAPLRAFDTSLTWTPCHDDWECATLNVPVDWVHAPAPGAVADTVPLALVRHRATSPEARLGALFVNPGGPGEGGADYIPVVTRRYPDELRERFDIVSWDPRGTGSSRPIDCVDDTVLDSVTDGPAVPNTAEALAAAHADTDVVARGCTERMGAYAGQVGTRNTAAISRPSASRSASRCSTTSATRTEPCSA